MDWARVIRTGFQPLKADDPVAFAPESCLIVRRPGAQCGLCREACPAGVLSGGQWSIAIDDDGCVGCGLCAAACPTGALKVASCTPAPDPAASRIVLECRRVAARDRDPDAVVVPCLGGLTAPDLIDLIAASDAPIAVVDRGWCAGCPVAREAAPWNATLDETKALLALLDTRLPESLAAEQRPLPDGRAQPVMASLRPDKEVGRRNFLRRLAGATAPSDALAESRRVVHGRGLVAPLKRRRVVERIGALAADLGQAFPAALLPAIKVAEGCEVNGLCAAVCPTGALVRETSADAITLQFEAERCIACNECQRVCPSKALRLWPDGEGTAPLGVMTLITRRAEACARCGDSFAPLGDEPTCPACAKTDDLMRAAASLRFGPPLFDETDHGALPAPRR